MLNCNVIKDSCYQCEINAACTEWNAYQKGREDKARFDIDILARLCIGGLIDVELFELLTAEIEGDINYEKN